MINNFSPAKIDNRYEMGYSESKEHLFARILVERSEEVQNLNVVELKSKIIANFGEAAFDILKEVLKESDFQYFNEHNDIKSLFELSNYAKLCYADQQIRRRFLADLGLRYCRTLASKENRKSTGQELLIYMVDAVAFLAKNKIQFIEDFSVLFSVVEPAVQSDSKTDNAKYDLGLRLKGDRQLEEVFFTSQDAKEGLSIRKFSAALQEAAYCDLTSGSFKADIPSLKKYGFSGGSQINYGEKAYWDIFFWLCPGVWLRRNLAKTTVTW
ncbi:MAG TPA: hypothetical protein VEC37_04530 [Bacillota bacterium]|nr:hypothetical protein [Bacillota bacterium]